MRVCSCSQQNSQATMMAANTSEIISCMIKKFNTNVPGCWSLWSILDGMGSIDHVLDGNTYLWDGGGLCHNMRILTNNFYHYHRRKRLHKAEIIVLYLWSDTQLYMYWLNFKNTVCTYGFPDVSVKIWRIVLFTTFI